MDEKASMKRKKIHCQAMALIFFILAIFQTIAHAGLIICRGNDGHLAVEIYQHCQPPIINDGGLFLIEDSALQYECQPCTDTEIANSWAMNGNSTMTPRSSAFSAITSISISALSPQSLGIDLEHLFNSNPLTNRFSIMVFRI